MQHNILIYRNEVEQAKALAFQIWTEIKQTQKKRKRFLLGCPGGRSPLETYKQLAVLIEKEQTDISQLVIVMMDDYVIKRDGKFIQCDENAHYSCRRFAREDIQNRLNQGLPEEKQLKQVWFPPIEKPEEYDERLQKAGGIDHFILASGTTDGHVAFNPPFTPKDKLSYIATLSLETRNDNLGTFPEFNNITEVPEYGLTVGLGTIKSQSKKMSLIINGAHKKNAAKRLLSIKFFDKSWPVSIIHECENVNIYLDAVSSPFKVSSPLEVSP